MKGGRFGENYQRINHDLQQSIWVRRSATKRISAADGDTDGD